MACNQKWWPLLWQQLLQHLVRLQHPACIQKAHHVAIGSLEGVMKNIPSGRRCSMKPLGQRWLCNGGMSLAVTAVSAQTTLVPSSIPVKQLSCRWWVSFGDPPRAKGNDTTKHVLAIMGEKNGSITEHTSFVLIKRFDRCSVRSTFCLCVHSEASRIPPGRVVRLRFWGGAGKGIIIGI